MATSKKITCEQAMEDLASRKHHVDETTASTMVKKYKAFRTKLASAKKNGGELPKDVPDLPTFITYNKKAIENLLTKTGCAGLRIYPAINADNQMTLVLVGVDGAGENMLDSTMLASVTRSLSATSKTVAVDEGQMSPPYPAPSNGF